MSSTLEAYLDSQGPHVHTWEPLGLPDGDEPEDALISWCPGCGAARLNTGDDAE